MAKKPKTSIDEMLSVADEQGEWHDSAEEAEAEPEAAAVTETTTPAGMMRVRILMAEHTDGRLKKTWKQNSVIEIDQYTAQRMIDRNWAAPTTAAINEMLVAYKGK